MGANIITGYTGTRHITPAMDASVYRSAFGADDYVLSDGNHLTASMPDINSFQVMDGLASMQGHMIQVTQETLAVSTCATGYERIDLVVLRFNHDSGTLVDSASLVIIEGTAVQTGNTPTVPTYNTGVIDNGASVVDMPLYRIDLAGSTVTFTRLFAREYSIEEIRPLEISLGSISSLPQTVADSRILAEHIAKPGDCLLSNPSAQTSDWTVTTSDGSVTVSGSISGSTTVTIWLSIPLE